MQDVHVVCERARLLPMLDAFATQFKAQAEEVSITDYGQCQKSEHSYIVFTWTEEVDETFIEHLNADAEVLDYSVYTVPCDDDDLPFSLTLSQERERSV